MKCSLQPRVQSARLVFALSLTTLLIGCSENSNVNWKMLKTETKSNGSKSVLSIDTSSVRKTNGQAQISMKYEVEENPQGLPEPGGVMRLARTHVYNFHCVERTYDEQQDIGYDVDGSEAFKDVDPSGMQGKTILPNSDEEIMMDYVCQPSWRHWFSS